MGLPVRVEITANFQRLLLRKYRNREPEVASVANATVCSILQMHMLP